MYVANDTDGNLYVGEMDGAARMQKFLRYGETASADEGGPKTGPVICQDPSSVFIREHRTA